LANFRDRELNNKFAQYGFKSLYNMARGINAQRSTIKTKASNVAAVAPLNPLCIGFLAVLVAVALSALQVGYPS
jgi:hypothetical protein